MAEFRWINQIGTEEICTPFLARTLSSRWGTKIFMDGTLKVSLTSFLPQVLCICWFVSPALQMASLPLITDVLPHVLAPQEHISMSKLAHPPNPHICLFFTPFCSYHNFFFFFLQYTLLFTKHFLLLLPSFCHLSDSMRNLWIWKQRLRE